MSRRLRVDGSSSDHNALHTPTITGDTMHRHTSHPIGRFTPVEHVFRHAGGELIDQPDLPLPDVGAPWRWAAIVWPDPSRCDGWAALEWSHGDRGWQLPATLVLGDVIEFGIVGIGQDEHPIANTTARWFGWLSDLTPLAAIVVGPYPDASSAAETARPLVDEVRCSQLLATMPDPDPCTHGDGA